jgi:hypothetical protein
MKKGGIEKLPLLRPSELESAFFSTPGEVHESSASLEARTTGSALHVFRVPREG